MRTTQGLHVQGWSSHLSVATVARWIMEGGHEIRSMSHLVSLAFDVLAEAIVTNGGKPVVGLSQAQEILEGIGKRNAFAPLKIDRNNSVADEGEFSAKEMRAIALNARGIK